MTTVAKAEYNGKARFDIVEAQQQNEVHYGDVPQPICCGVTLFHPHPCGADQRSALRSLMFPGGNRLLVAENEFLEVPRNQNSIIA